MTQAAERGREATLYRMVTDDHVCPYGLKARDLASCACVGGDSGVPPGAISLTREPDDGRDGAVDVPALTAGAEGA